MRKLFYTLAIIFMTSGLWGQDCSFGPISTTSGGANITAGQLYGYTACDDIDVPSGTILTVNRVTFPIESDYSSLQYAHIKIRKSSGGMPGSVIYAFDSIVPASQELVTVFDTTWSSFNITVDLPSSVQLLKGKYFFQLQVTPLAEPGEHFGVGLYSAGTGYGTFSFYSDNNGETWGSSSLGDFAITTSGICTDDGTIPPDYGDACSQGDTAVNHTSGGFSCSPLYSDRVTDDFFVPANTTFYLTQFVANIVTQGGGVSTATFNIRSSVNDAPGEILYTVENLGVTTQKFLDWFGWVEVLIRATFDFETPIVLTEGKYFIEMVGTPMITDDLLWEVTNEVKLGGYSYRSNDSGLTWILNELNGHGNGQVFTMNGFFGTNVNIKDVQAQKVNFYPNPVDDYLVISSDKKIKNVLVYNVFGQQVISQEMNISNGMLNMSSLPGGVYIVRAVLENDKIETFKVNKK